MLQAMGYKIFYRLRSEMDITTVFGTVSLRSNRGGGILVRPVIQSSDRTSSTGRGAPIA